MLQRASIIAATAHQPELLLADEPTSALDADRADQVITTLVEAARTTIVVSHDLRLLGRHATDLAVFYGGRLVEHGPASEVMGRPGHPYTRALLASIPEPGSRRTSLPTPIPGQPPRLDSHAPGCEFAPRCEHAIDACHDATPEAVRVEDGRGVVACHLVAVAQ